MCIGILSEYDVPMPDEDTLKRCWEGNSDGAGYAYLTESNLWQVKKGFMKWSDFIDSYNEEEFKPENVVVMHFRIGTSGRCPSKGGAMGKGEMCTHPFPVSGLAAELEATEYEAKQIVIHNGVVGQGDGFLSDTMVAIRDHISVLWPYVKKDEKIRDLLQDLLDCGPRYNGSRWFISEGEFYTLLGGWELDDKTKLYYTHDGYKPFQSVWPAGAYAGEYDWRYDYIDDDVTNLNTARTKQGLGKTILTKYMPGKLTYQFCSAATWDWEKWDAREVEVEVVQDETFVTDSKEVEVDDDTIHEVFDSSGNNVIALVDGYGNVIWDEITGAPEEEANIILDGNTFNCITCDAKNLEMVDLDEGCCPFCNTLLMPDGAVTEQVESNLACPNCKEKNHLDQSSFDIGDTECYRCGAVFLSTVVGEDSIVSWNEDTKRAHEELIAEAMKGV